MDYREKKYNMNGVMKKAQPDIRTFFEKFAAIKYRKNETIIHAQDQPNGVYYIKSGYVRMTTFFPEGNQLTLNIFKPESYFPMIWAIADQPTNYYFQAITDVSLHRAPKSEFLSLIQNHPEELFKLTKRILIGLDGFIYNSQHLLFGDAYHRVLSALIVFAKRFGEKDHGNKIIINLPITHQEIANLAGLTRETTTIFLNKLKEEELISYSRHIFTLNDIAKLEELFSENISSEVVSGIV